MYDLSTKPYNVLQMFSIFLEYLFSFVMAVVKKFAFENKFNFLFCVFFLFKFSHFKNSNLNNKILENKTCYKSARTSSTKKYIYFSIESGDTEKKKKNIENLFKSVQCWTFFLACFVLKIQ